MKTKKVKTEKIEDYISVDSSTGSVDYNSENLDKLKAEYVEDKEIAQEKKTRKRRTKKEITEDSSKFESFKQTIFPVSELLLNILCSRLPNPLPPTELELKMFDASMNAVAEKYFEKFIEYSAEVGLLLACSVIIVPRMKRTSTSSVLHEWLEN